MFGNIVLAVDGSAPSDNALAYATQLSMEHGSTLHVVHVVEIVAGRGGGTLHVNEQEMQAKIRGQVRALTEAGINADLELRSAMVGRCGNVIADVAAEREADVIVTGSRGHTGFAGMLLGSVAQRLLHLADCPVLVIPRGTAPRAIAGAEGRGLAAATS